MKKILLATTLLAGFAGVASAEVALSGDARVGVISTAGGDLQLTSRARVSFALSGESDSGLSFGASFRADNAVAASVGAGGSVYVSGAFGKLSVGDVDSAAKATVGNVSGVGLTGLGDQNEIFFGTHSMPAALYEYSTGAVSVALSTGQAGTEQYAAGVKYSAGAYTVALGYEGGAGAGTDRLYIGGSATFGATTVKAVYTDRFDDFAISADYVAGATTVTAFYHDLNGAFGLGATYDLGGGAKVVGGVVKPEAADASYDLGLSFSF